MKVLIISTLLLSVTFGSCEISRPDEFIAKLEAYRDKSLSLVKENSEQFADIREHFQREILRKNYATVFGVIDEAVKDVRDASEELVMLIAAEVPNFCFDNLKAIVDRTTEFYGYELANCIESRDISVRGSDMVNNAAVDSIFPPLLNSVVGRNVYIEAENVILRLSEIYEEHEKNGTMDSVKAELVEFDETWQSAIETFLVACFNDVRARIRGEFTAAITKITQCKNYGSRAPRR